MVSGMYSSSGRSMVAATVVFCAFFAASASAREDFDGANARVASQRAHFAHEFCGISAERIEKYKLKFKATLSESTDFEASWKRGWPDNATSSHASQ